MHNNRLIIPERKMEIQVSELEAEKFWQEPLFVDLLPGCKHVRADLLGKGKYLILTPLSIVFEKWRIKLEAEFSESLATASVKLHLPYKAEL